VRPCSSIMAETVSRRDGLAMVLAFVGMNGYSLVMMV
jgi:hypothetical protein